MKAVGFKEFGDPEVLELMDIPEVSAGRGEIRIRNYFLHIFLKII